MPWIIIASAATACSVFILMLVNIYLFYRYREQFMKLWAIAWGVHVLRYICLIVATLQPAIFGWELANRLSIIISAIILIYGVMSFIGRKQSKWLPITGFLIALWTFAAPFRHMNLMAVVIPIFAYLSITYIIIGSQIFKAAKNDEVAARIVGLLFIAWGIHQADYPILRPIEWFAPWGFLIGSFFAASIAIGLVLIYFERTYKALKEKESLHRRLNRLYSVLSQINAAIIRIRQPEELFVHACRIAVEAGNLKLAWIGLLDPETMKINPVARWGIDDGYVDHLNLSAADVPEGQGPTGIAVREGKYSVCPDWNNDQKILLWKEMGSERGYRSSMAFPLHIEKQIIGAMTLYAGETNFFSSDEVQLLKPLADNISYAISFMEKEKQRRQMENVLRESEEKHRLAMSVVSDGLWDWDCRTGSVYYSPVWCKMLEEEFVPPVYDSWEHRIHPEDLQGTQESLGKHLEGKTEYWEHEHRLKTKSGRWKWVLGRGGVVARDTEGSPIRMVGSMVDISEKKQTEQNYSMLFHEMLDGFALHEIVCNDDGKPVNYRFLDINPAFERITGLKAADIIGKTVLDVLPGTEQSWIETYGKVALTSEAAIFEDYSADLKKHFHVTAFQPASKQFACIFADITDSKRAEVALKESETKYRSMMEAMDDAVYICSGDFRIEYMNTAMIKRIGYDAAGELCYKVIHGVHEKCSWCVYDKVMMGQFIKTEVVSPKDNRIYHVSNSPIFHSHGAISKLTIFRDITETKKIEERFLHAQKMEAIGSLAGGIAHDLNNILFPISGLSEMLLDETPSDSPAYESIEQIHKSSQRGSDLVKQILAFSRQSNPQKMPIRIQQVLKEVMKLIRATITTNIVITSSIESECGMIFANPSQIHQILMNLITNSYHAVEEKGGAIHIELKETALERDDLLDNSVTSGRYACITVSDTGVGIDQSLIDKIFDPYFTTKKRGKGTGLGLSVVHGIVKEHGGIINVASEVGKGTSFNVYLPILKNVQERKDASTSNMYPSGSERILLVDDEEPIAKMMKMMLERLGYRVTVRASSPDALEAFKASPSSFDLVISDRGMPNMTGEQLAYELISIRTDLPIILCTGFSEERDEIRAKEMGIKGFLKKPVATSDLAIMVRKVLDESKGSTFD